MSWTTTNSGSKRSVCRLKERTLRRFRLSPVFKSNEFDPPSPMKDRGVSLAFDPQGRVLVAKEDRGLLRLTLSPARNGVVAVDQVDESLEECRGLAFIGHDLYANANNAKGLYRLRDDGDDLPLELILSTTGGVGHGRTASRRRHLMECSIASMVIRLICCPPTA